MRRYWHECWESFSLIFLHLHCWFKIFQVFFAITRVGLESRLCKWKPSADKASLTYRECIRRARLLLCVALLPKLYNLFHKWNLLQHNEYFHWHNFSHANCVCLLFFFVIFISTPKILISLDWVAVEIETEREREGKSHWPGTLALRNARKTRSLEKKKTWCTLPICIYMHFYCTRKSRRKWTKTEDRALTFSHQHTWNTWSRYAALCNAFHLLVCVCVYLFLAFAFPYLTRIAAGRADKKRVKPSARTCVHYIGRFSSLIHAPNAFQAIMSLFSPSTNLSSGKRKKNIWTKNPTPKQRFDVSLFSTFIFSFLRCFWCSSLVRNLRC